MSQIGQEKLISQLHAELKENADSLKVKADLVSKLYEEREEERKKNAQVMSDLSKLKRQVTDAPPPPANTATQPLDEDGDRVKRKGDVLSKRTLRQQSGVLSVSEFPSEFLSSAQGIKKLRGFDGIKIEDAFCTIADFFYERFKKEKIVDVRRKEGFAQNIDSAPALTRAEQDLISSSMKLAEEVSAKAKRVAGTASESVEKYLHKPEGGGAAVAMSVAKMDVSAVSLFAELWLLDR
ncbi:hypothetical protein TrLO_g9936 [Triparma laevis f. longispina]|uniref:Uncharacterized protein n=1 Tax=Triparma laevis f. longispina TaxID=1714387 RepID=A0A9W6ZFB7_9STRA|nr:hypothetical protein TrLO_g9936 [Triparma laevis f. longispina]